MSWAGQIDGPIPVYILGEPDEDGVQPIIDLEPGYRLNIAPELMSAELEPFRATPKEPMRIWAGDAAPYPETVFLLFVSEEAARATSLGAWWVVEEG